MEVLGYLDEKGTDILSIIRQYGLPEEFPITVQEAARAIEQEVEPEEIKRRVDLRHLNTFTIDGIDAKDIDDAVSIGEAGKWKLLSRSPYSRRCPLCKGKISPRQRGIGKRETQYIY